MSIQGNDRDGFELYCDECEDVEDGFEEFDEAVQYKKDYRWRSVKSAHDKWFDLCPSCSTADIIQKHKEM